MRKIIIALAVLVVVAIGTYYLVFNKNTSQTTSNIPQTLPSVSQTPVNVTQTPEAPNVSISIKNFSFNPVTLTVKAGTKVTWTNNDNVSHTVTSDSGNLLDSPTISPGQSFSFTFTKVGTEDYHCAIHTMMRAKIVVE